MEINAFEALLIMVGYFGAFLLGYCMGYINGSEKND